METLKAVSDRLFPKGADGKWAHFRGILFLPWSKRRGNLLLRNCAVNVPVNKQVLIMKDMIMHFNNLDTIVDVYIVILCGLF